MIIFVIFILLVSIISNLYLHITFTDSKLVIKIFKIPIFIKKGKKLIEFFEKIVSASTSMDIENTNLMKKMFECINFDKIDFGCTTKVDNYIEFSIIQKIILILVNYISKAKSDKITKINYIIKHSSKNKFHLDVYIRLYLLKIIAVLIKERKRNYASKRNI